MNLGDNELASSRDASAKYSHWENSWATEMSWQPCLENDRVRTKLELREHRILVRDVLDPLWLVRMSVEREALLQPVLHLEAVELLLAFVLGPAPEANYTSIGK